MSNYVLLALRANDVETKGKNKRYNIPLYII